jgi:hypothetical protein
MDEIYNKANVHAIRTIQYNLFHLVFPLEKCKDYIISFKKSYVLGSVGFIS